jgi:tetratricopeptide (TPR) repeat protein
MWQKIFSCLELTVLQSDPDHLDAVLIQKVFDWVIEQIKIKMPKAYSLLRTLALFDPESMPLGALLAGFPPTDFLQASAASIPEHWIPATLRWSELLSRPRSNSNEDRDGRTTAVRDLVSPPDRAFVIQQMLASGLVGVRSSTAWLTIRMHEVLPQLLLRDLDTQQSVLLKTVRSAYSLLHIGLNSIRGFPEDPDCWREYAILTPHFQSLVRFCLEHDVNDVELAQDFYWIGRYLLASDRLTDTFACFSWCIKASSEDPGLQLEISEYHAACLAKLGRMEESKQLLVKICDEIPLGNPKTMSFVLRVQRRLAQCCYEQDHLLQARDLFVEILEWHNSLDEDEHALILQSLATTLQRMGEIEESERIISRSMLLRRKKLGRQYLDMLDTEFHQARLLRDRGRYVEATVQLEQVLSDLKTTAGPHHPNTLRVASRLAHTRMVEGSRNQDKLVAAMKLAQTTLESQRGLAHTNQAEIAFTNWTLANIMFRLGRFEDAETRLMDILHNFKARDTTQNTYDPMIRYVLRDYGHILSVRGEHGRAISMLRIYDTYVRGTVAAAKLADLYRCTNQHKQAIEILECTISIQLKYLGRLHADVCYAFWMRGRLYNDCESYALARQDYEAALDGYYTTPGAMFGSQEDVLLEYRVVLRALGLDVEDMAEACHRYTYDMVQTP